MVRALLIRFDRKIERFAYRLSRSLKVIGTDTNRSATHDPLLRFHSNHAHFLAVSEINGDFSRKSDFFNRRVFCAPLKRYPFELIAGVSDLTSYNNEATWLIKKFDYTLGHLAENIVTDRRTDGRTDGHWSTAKTALTHSVAR